MTKIRSAAEKVHGPASTVLPRPDRNPGNHSRPVSPEEFLADLPATARTTVVDHHYPETKIDELALLNHETAGRDTAPHPERALLTKETAELRDFPEQELQELAAMYVAKGRQRRDRHQAGPGTDRA